MPSAANSAVEPPLLTRDQPRRGPLIRAREAAVTEGLDLVRQLSDQSNFDIDIDAYEKLKRIKHLLNAIRIETEEELETLWSENSGVLSGGFDGSGSGLPPTTSTKSVGKEKAPSLSRNEDDSTSLQVLEDESDTDYQPRSKRRQTQGLRDPRTDRDLTQQSTSVVFPDMSNSVVNNIPAEATGSKRQLGEFDRFACPICLKRFTRSTTLREHSRSHKEERPYTCDSCPRAFSRLKDKKRHEGTHLKAKPYTCGLMHSLCEGGCGREFAREDGLLAHFRTKVGWGCISPFLRDITMICDYEWGENVSCRARLADLKEQGDDLLLGPFRAVQLSGCERLFATTREFKSHIKSEEGTNCIRLLVQQYAIIGHRLKVRMLRKK